MAIEILKVSTGNPATLIDEISNKIYNNQITTWVIDGNKLSHKGEQYKDHFYFEFQINNSKGLLEFILHTSGTSVFADSRASQLLERMLLYHFSTSVEIIK